VGSVFPRGRKLRRKRNPSKTFPSDKVSEKEVGGHGSRGTCSTGPWSQTLEAGQYGSCGGKTALF